MLSRSPSNGTHVLSLTRPLHHSSFKFCVHYQRYLANATTYDLRSQSGGCWRTDSHGRQQASSTTTRKKTAIQQQLLHSKPAFGGLLGHQKTNNGHRIGRSCSYVSSFLWKVNTFPGRLCCRILFPFLNLPGSFFVIFRHVIGHPMYFADNELSWYWKHLSSRIISDLYEIWEMGSPHTDSNAPFRGDSYDGLKWGPVRQRLECMAMRICERLFGSRLHGE